MFLLYKNKITYCCNDHCQAQKDEKWFGNGSVAVGLLGFL
jgi:hypothetical protein